MPSPSGSTKTKVVEAAMACIAEKGLEQTTFQAIADRAGISQPLVVYHLKKRENIFVEVMNKILDDSLMETETALAKHESAAGRLREYLGISLAYFRSTPHIAKIYIAFYYLSSFDPVYRAMNERLKSEATARILNILALGLGRGEFRLENPALTAKMIHVYLTGLLLNLASETPRFPDGDFLDKMADDCLKMAGAR